MGSNVNFQICTAGNVPCDNSCFLIIGMFIEFAIEQATKGTKRPHRVGRVLARELRPRAVPRAPPVAQTYDVPENLIIRTSESFLLFLQHSILHCRCKFTSFKPMIIG